MISVVVVTYNEGELLRDCLESVKEADEIVIVDLGSKDATLKIAKEFNVKVFSHRRIEYVEQVRDFAVSKASGEWILVLDPDERVGIDLWRKLKSISEEGKYTAVNIPRKNIFFGKWISHTNWWPDKHVRFFKKGSLSWSGIHIYPKVLGEVLELPEDENLVIIHYGYNSISDFIERQNRYAEIESEDLYKRGIKFDWPKFFWWPTRVFLVRFIKHKGFLDGIYGFILTYLMMIYKITVAIKLWEKGSGR